MEPKMENLTLSTNNQQEIITIENLQQKADIYLGEEAGLIEKDISLNIIKDIVSEAINIKSKITNGDGRIVSSSKYESGLTVGEEKNVSMGKAVAARHWGIDIAIPEDSKESGDIKRTRKLLIESTLNSNLCQKLNKELALNLVEQTKNKDALKAEAYNQIAKRSGIENKQLGILAEQIIIGVLEGLSIDRPDLGFNIIEANAYQDVNNKIDFIIHTKEKKRNVGINRQDVSFEEKSIGIQFTINKNAMEHKLDQINKAKERGVNINDIIYVDIDSRLLQKAIIEWEKSGKPVAGPWKYLPQNIRTETFKNLFVGLLNEEQQKSLRKFTETE